MATRLKRKKKKPSGRDAQNQGTSIKPPLSAEQAKAQNRRVLIAIAVTALVVVMVFLVLQFV